MRLVVQVRGVTWHEVGAYVVTTLLLIHPRYQVLFTQTGIYLGSLNADQNLHPDKIQLVTTYRGSLLLLPL